VEAANVALDVNAQNSTMFWVTVAIAGALALLLLFWRGATTVQNTAAKEAAGAVTAAHTDAGSGGDGKTAVPQSAVALASKAVQPRARWSLKGDVLTDPLFLASTVLSVAFAVAAAWAIYTANSGWGSDPVTDVFAVVSALLSAAGLRSLIASAAGK
jgi:hypothetical protein